MKGDSEACATLSTAVGDLEPGTMGICSSHDTGTDAPDLHGGVRRFNKNHSILIPKSWPESWPESRIIQQELLLKRQTAEAEEFNSIMSGLEIPPAQIWSTSCVTIERAARPTRRSVSVDPGDMEREVVQLRALLEAERNRRKHAERHIRKMELKLKRAAQSAPGPAGPPAAARREPGGAVGITWAEGWVAAMPEVMGVLADVGLTEDERHDTVAKIQAIPARWPDGRPTCADDASRPPADGTCDKEASVVSGPLVFVNVPALYMGEFSLSADRGGSPVGSPTFSEKLMKDARPEGVDPAPAAPAPAPDFRCNSISMQQQAPLTAAEALTAEGFIGLQRSSTPHEGVTPRPFAGGASGTRERGASMERDASVGSDMSELSEPRSPEQPEEPEEGIDPTADRSCSEYGSEYVRTKRRGKRLVHC
jgi:hypothetical protein